MLTYAERLGERPDGSNPCRHVERFPQKRRERFLSTAELARLGDALTAYKGSPFVVAAIKLLVFTEDLGDDLLGAETGAGIVDNGLSRDAGILDDPGTGNTAGHAFDVFALGPVDRLIRHDGRPSALRRDLAGSSSRPCLDGWLALLAYSAMAQAASETAAAPSASLFDA